MTSTESGRILIVDRGYVEVQGHRGDRQYIPENTIPSFISAFENGASVVELDVLLTSDGVPVVHHDYKLNKSLCVNSDGTELSDDEQRLLCEIAYAELKGFDVGTKLLEKFPQQKVIPDLHIPSLEELFVAVDSYFEGKERPLCELRYNVEIKRDPCRPWEVLSVQKICEGVLDLVNKCQMSSRVSYSSFDMEILTAIRELGGDVRLGVLYCCSEESERLLRDMPKGSHSVSSIDGLDYIPSEHLQYCVYQADKLNASTVSPDHELVKSKEDVLYLSQGGRYRVVLWTVDEEAKWEQFASWGVDGIITDKPRECVQYLQGL